MTRRVCIRCGVDLAAVMGVYVFTPDANPLTHLRRMPDVLLCVTHGGNGRNVVSADELATLGVTA